MFKGIRAHCRRDCDINRIWQKLGFVAIGELAGRSKKGSILNDWCLGSGFPNLFDNLFTNSKLDIVIDATVFFSA
ncbi:MAG: hypothetical protein JXB48_19180 [Candidatus Latescibacteria bacterium]|nr:hypothetical protein [Candidatus Latescibacterota bacterium]